MHGRIDNAMRAARRSKGALLWVCLRVHTDLAMKCRMWVAGCGFELQIRRESESSKLRRLDSLFLALVNADPGWVVTAAG